MDCPPGPSIPFNGFWTSGFGQGYLDKLTKNSHGQIYKITGWSDGSGDLLGQKHDTFLVKTSDGKVLLENVSLEQLRAQAPEIHEFIKTAVAREDGSKKDASIRVNRIDAAVR